MVEVDDDITAGLDDMLSDLGWLRTTKSKNPSPVLWGRREP